MVTSLTTITGTPKIYPMLTGSEISYTKPVLKIFSLLISSRNSSSTGQCVCDLSTAYFCPCRRFMKLLVLEKPESVKSKRSTCLKITLLSAAMSMES